MKNGITNRNIPNLPVVVSTEIQQLMTSPAKYLENLPLERIEDERPRNAVMLSQYKRSLDRNQQLMYISLMIMEVNDFFNVKGSMNQRQIKLTAELILDNPGFYDLTLGNIKACFRQKMMSAKLYDRLDGNIIIGWLREFKSEMADRCEMIHIGQERMRQAEEARGGVGAISHDVYKAILERRAKDGDEEAKRILEDYRLRHRVATREQSRQKELEFFKVRHQYLKQKGYYGNGSPKS